MCNTHCSTLFTHTPVNPTGIPADKALNHDLFELFTVTGREEIEASAQCNTDFQVTAAMKDSAMVTSRSQRFVINFRPAHLDPLDNHMPLIGIPSDVPWNKDTGDQKYYFATIRLAEDVLPNDVQPLCEVEGGDVFPEVVLGPLLGKGSFGKVYRGIWKGAPVAVKVKSGCVHTTWGLLYV